MINKQKCVLNCKFTSILCFQNALFNLESMIYNLFYFLGSIWRQAVELFVPDKNHWKIPWRENPLLVLHHLTPFQLFGGQGLQSRGSPTETVLAPYFPFHKSMLTVTAPPTTSFWQAVFGHASRAEAAERRQRVLFCCFLFSPIRRPCNASTMRPWDCTCVTWKYKEFIIIF